MGQEGLGQDQRQRAQLELLPRIRGQRDKENMADLNDVKEVEAAQ